jgi:formamidopyrimidine-DNA glycosylase
MFELPETITLASQLTAALAGRTVRHGSLGNVTHKFVWYNRSPEEFAGLVAGRRIGAASARGRWLFVPLEPGHVLVLGECGGKLLLTPAGSPPPATWHLRLDLDDGSVLTETTTMWGAMELFESGAELERDYVRDMRPTPVDAAFTPDYFERLVEEAWADGRRTVKSLLTQDQLVPGLGNAIAQDIMFRAGLHPRRSLADLDAAGRLALHGAIVGTVAEAIALGGRNDEVDLHGRPGGYVRRMDRAAAGRPCPRCDTTIEKIQYLGGACYLCPACQPAPAR